MKLHRDESLKFIHFTCNPSHRWHLCCSIEPSTSICLCQPIIFYNPFSPLSSKKQCHQYLLVNKSAWLHLIHIRELDWAKISSSKGRNDSGEISSRNAWILDVGLEEGDADGIAIGNQMGKWMETEWEMIPFCYCLL